MARGWSQTTPCFSGPPVNSAALGLECGLAQILGRREVGGGGWGAGKPQIDLKEECPYCHTGEDFEAFSTSMCMTSCTNPAAKIFGLRVKD